MSDAHALANLVSQLGYPTSPAEMASRLRPILNHPEYITYVAEISTTVIGFVGARLGNALEFNGQYARLAGLIVDESWQGRGIGTLLMDSIERWARNQGTSRITLTSSDHRWHAHGFYRRRGYQKTGLRFIKQLD